MRTPWRRRASAFLAALLLAVVWGAVAQTQFNLAALQDLGAAVPIALRAKTTAQDVLGFGPIYGAVVVVAFLLAFPLAGAIARRRSDGARALWFALAGFAALVVAIRIVDAVTPPPVLIAATRTLSGLLAMTIGGAIAGWLFAQLTRSPAATPR